MQSYRTCHASQIESVRVGQSVIAPPAHEPAEPIEATAVDPEMGETRTPDEIDAERAERDRPERNDLKMGDRDEGDQTQEVIHLVLAGGEKRSILRSNNMFAPSVLERRQADFPPYAQRQPWQALPDRNGVTGPNSVNSSSTVNAPVNFVEPNSPHAGYKLGPDTNGSIEGQAYPRVGDWLVEDYDIMTDVWVQKIYDNATFGRYFKANLS